MEHYSALTEANPGLKLEVQHTIDYATEVHILTTAILYPLLTRLFEDEVFGEVCAYVINKNHPKRGMFSFTFTFT